jgi:hypothetical protein
MSTNLEKADKIKTHLEFLGYEVLITDGTKEPNGILMIKALSQAKYNLVMWFAPSGFIGVRSNWNGMKKMTAVEQWQFVNKCNSDMFMTRLYIDKDGDATFQCVYVGEYDKTVFGNFVDGMQNDIRAVFNDSDVQRLLIA